MTKTIVGIDYSLTSPAICISNDRFDLSFTSWHFLSNRKKCQGNFIHNIRGTAHQPYTDPMQRFKQISDWVLHILAELPQPLHISLEGYAYGAKGQGLFQIAENSGILKYRLLHDLKYSYNIIVPSVIKKGATGKGNADKDKMYDSFNKETNIDLKQIFDTDKTGNPISDIVDAYYVAKVGYLQEQLKQYDGL